MGLFETVAITDLKFRLIVGPAAVVFAFSMVAGVHFYGEEPGLIIGIVTGFGLAVMVAYGIDKILP